MNKQDQSKQMLLVMMLSIGLSFFIMSLLQSRMAPQPQQQQVRVLSPKEVETTARLALDIEKIRDDKDAAQKEIKRLRERIKEDPQSEQAAADLLRIGVICQEVISEPQGVRKALLDSKAVSEKDLGNSDSPTYLYPVLAVYNKLMHEHRQSVFIHTAAVYKYLVVPPTERKIGTPPFKEFEGYTRSIVDRRESPRDKAHVPVFFQENGREVVKEFLEIATEHLEPQYKTGWRYKMMDFLVRAISHIPGTKGKSSPFSAYGLAIILFAVLIRLALAPLTHMQFRSMRDMQKKMPAFQSEMKKLQEKYKDKKDQMKMYQEMRALQKKHGVNPLGNVGCLLMVVQMPILFTLYYVIQHYQFQFQNAHFLWISNLARHDWYLLGLYVVSMIAQSKLMSATTPPTDPEQAQMQKMMMYMMPVMFTFFLKGFPAALILYWFTFNVIYTAQQYIVMREGQPVSEGSFGFKGVFKNLLGRSPAEPSSNGSVAPASDEDVPPRPEKEREVQSAARKAKRKRRKR